MKGFGLLLLASTLAYCAMKAHGRRAYWFGFSLAVVAGVLFALSTWLIGITQWIGQIPFVALAVVFVGAVTIGLDVKDKQPDRPAVIFAVLTPLFIAPAIIDLPTALTLVGQGFHNLSQHLNEAANSTRTR